MICGIRWVDELIEVAGGASIFPEHRDARLARDRIVTADDVARRDPELIVASWCGKPVQLQRIESRPGWNRISAVHQGHMYEIKSALILQPGPAALTDGVQQLHQYVTRVATAPPGRR